ncbi:hypothetical protein ACFLZJ_00180 [Nanoarchaeota archaeon]
MVTNLEVGDIVMCTVERIAGTIVFVKIDGNGQGSIILSEIAPGRIRNLREYVVPKKKIVCKILRKSPNGNIELSLRRVTKKDQKEIKEQYKKEKSCKSILKSILGDKSKKVIEEILKDCEKIDEFMQDAKKDSKKLEEIIGKEQAKKVLKILNAQKQKKAIVKREIHLTTINPGGLKEIKDLLSKVKDIEVGYISAGKYSLKAESEDPKAADNILRKATEDMEKQTKKQGMTFSIKEK